MSVTTEPQQALLDQTRRAVHPQCVVCGRADACGLGLEFRLDDDGGVEAVFQCQRIWQGYEGVLHGGITSMLLDGAMTNCLFAHGIVAVTGKMTIRFRAPVDLGGPVSVRAHIASSHAPLYIVEAKIIQDDQLKARAQAKFMEKSGVPGAISVSLPV